jgi:small subunit ribosomal protein S6
LLVVSIYCQLGWATIQLAIRGVDMRLYESVFIARQDISTGQVDALCEEFEGIITSGGGKILKKEYWGLKTLAYRIKKNRKGHYILFNIEADAATMDEYDRKLGLNEDVIRVLTIKTEDVSDEPSIMMQSKSDRPNRDGDSRDGDSQNKSADKASTESKE